MSLQDEKNDIERTIARARDGVGERIDELDRRLRSTLDVKTFVQEHAAQLIAGGAAFGFLVGFVSPRTLGRMITLGIPLAIVAMKVKKSRFNGSSGSESPEGI
jgi:hypothetical protein